MLFYLSLLIVLLIVAIVVLWLYRTVAGSRLPAIKAIHPGSRNGSTRQSPKRVMRTTVNDTPTPWGWGSNTTPENQARAYTAKMAGHANWDKKRSGRKPVGKNTGSKAKKQDVGWPYREEKSEFRGKTYKVTRSTRPKRTNLRTLDKPWGW